MPQMMPCSWFLIFLMMVILFFLINSNWGSFFLSSFSTSKMVRLTNYSFWL